MEKYRVFFHLDLFDSIPKRSTQRRKILDFLRSLEDNPFAPGDFSDKDASLSVRQIKIIGDYAITYWTDHPVKSVMVLDLKPAD
jgi:mRNA-degrading endonuclease RelE of RelBE toxin-antitoxin system